MSTASIRRCPGTRHRSGSGSAAAAHLICNGHEPASVVKHDDGKIKIQFPSSAAVIAAVARYQTVIDNIKARADRAAPAL